MERILTKKKKTYKGLSQIATIEGERWAEIKGCPGYEISDLGRIKSVNSHGTGIDVELRQNRTKTGYLITTVWVGKKQKTIRVHKAVAMAFIPNTDNKPQINHIDGDKTNNRAENLEWVTNRENMRHAYDTGLMENARERARENGKAKGDNWYREHNEKTKVPVYAIKCGTGDKQYFSSIKECEKGTGILYQYIWRIAHGKRKTAKGYTFVLADGGDVHA